MNFIKRGLASITRRKGKSLILFAVILILGNVMAGAIAIDQGTKSVESTIKNKLGAVATITEDFDKIEKDAKDDPNVYEKLQRPGVKTINEIGELSEVNYFDYSVNGYLSTEKFKAAQPKEMESMGGDGESHFFTFKGINFNEVLDIKNKIIQLKDGRVFEKSEVEKGNNVVLISEEVAKANDVRVGDKVTLDYTSSMGVMIADDGAETKVDPVKKDYQVEVIGIFSVLQSEKKAKKILEF